MHGRRAIDSRLRWDSEVNPYPDPDDPGPWPWLKVAGLDNEPLELVWFDDRRGVILDRQAVTPVNSEIEVELPDMDPDATGRQFFKSVAFIIQPAGFTPERDFAELPNEPIGQILVDIDPDETINLPEGWHEESASVPKTTLRFVAGTKPEIEESDHRYEWTFGSGSPISIDDVNYIEHEPLNTTSEYSYKVHVDIWDKDSNERVSGDTIYLKVYNY